MKIENSGARISQVCDNSETLYLDAYVQITIKTADKGRIRWRRGSVVIYGLDMTTYNPFGLPTTVPAILGATKKNTIYKSEPVCISRAFGGFTPKQFGVLIENKCGVDVELVSSAADWSK